MAKWVYEAGIGENRAALVEGDRILEMAIERDDAPGPRVGAILSARLIRKADASGRGLVAFADASSASLTPVPSGITEGSALIVEVMRAAIREGSLTKPPRVRIAPPEAMFAAGPDLLQRVKNSGIFVRQCDVTSDTLDRVGWGETLEEAASGIVAAPDVLLRISPTPAMTLIDVDGTTAAPELACAGARAAGQAIRRFGITGSIGIDLPTLTAKADRQAAAAALDAVLPQPFERTAVNGFGFLQIIRRRERMSLLELLVQDPVGAAAASLLRQAERASGHGSLTLHAPPSVIARITVRADWIDALARRVGASVVLQEEAALAISAGYASRAQN